MEKLQILYVENDRILRMALQKAIENKGRHSILVATDGPQALEVIDRKQHASFISSSYTEVASVGFTDINIDVLITGLYMSGGMNGIELVEVLSRLGLLPPIVIFAVEEQLAAAIREVDTRLGEGYPVLKKPLAAAKVIQTIRGKRH